MVTGTVQNIILVELPEKCRQVHQRCGNEGRQRQHKCRELLHTEDNTHFPTPHADTYIITLVTHTLKHKPLNY